MKELIRVRVQYASRQQCCKTHKRPFFFTTSTNCDIAELPTQCVKKKTSRIYHQFILLICGTFFTTTCRKNVVTDLVVCNKEWGKWLYGGTVFQQHNMPKDRDIFWSWNIVFYYVTSGFCTALYWVMTKGVVVISYRLFGTTYRSHHLLVKNLNSSPSKMGPITSVRNYHYSLYNNPEECSTHSVLLILLT